MKKPKLIALDSKVESGEKNHAFYREIEADILARTLWGEARGEGSAGMQAVACVILNRAAESALRGRMWWGNNIVQICQKPYQFSCWNRSDPNFRKLQDVDEGDLYFVTALRIARRAIMGALKDPTGGATHYHAKGVQPYWVRGETKTAEIGRHVFYRIV